MLKAEQASKPGPAQTPPNGTETEAIQSGPISPCPSINRHNDDGGNGIESSVNESERGEECCCHSRRRRSGGRREGNEAAAVTGSTEMQRCGSEAQDEDLDKSVFTGQCVCVHYVCAFVTGNQACSCTLVLFFMRVCTLRGGKSLCSSLPK